MHISVDGGGLCTSTHFGTTIFSTNLLKALAEFDHKNYYHVYTFCDVSTDIIQPTKHLQLEYLFPKKGWMKVRVSLEEYLRPKKFFLALNQALPWRIQSSIITVSHGLSFLHFPGLYPDDYVRLKTQLDDYISRSKYIVVSSKKVKDELIGYNMDLNKQIIVIPFGIPSDFAEYKTEKREKYFLFVGNNQPIKNVKFLIDTFKSVIKLKPYSSYKLYLVGPFAEYKSKHIEVFEHCSREELLLLYRKAKAYVAASFYESFNFPMLEALSQKCPVISLPSAVIPEMEKYIKIAGNKEEFIKQMKTTRYSEINIGSLKKTFSWKSYVEKLSSLYN